MTDKARFPDLDGVAVFITGGGSGIGASLTEGFLRQGARVAFIGRSDYSDTVDAMATRTGNRPLFIQGDVTDTPALHAAMDRAADAHGPLRVLVNNAANDQRYAQAEVTPEIWDDMMHVNLRHQFFSAQKAAQMMAAAGGGSIINYTSIAYMMGIEDLSIYGTAKAGITGMTRSLARAWGPDGIRVNAIAPGMVLTERQLEDWISEDDIEGHVARQSLKHTLGPDDMVGPTLFLASDTSGAITGQVLVADAGVVTTG